MWVIYWPQANAACAIDDNKTTCVSVGMPAEPSPQEASITAANEEVAMAVESPSPEPVQESVPARTLSTNEMAAQLVEADKHLHVAERFIHENASGGLRSRIMLAKQHILAAAAALEA